MAEQTRGRTAYIAGIGVLVVVVSGALVWRGWGRGGRGDQPAEAGVDAGTDGEAGADGAAETEAGAGAAGEPTAEVDAASAPPANDPAGCRTYCQGLADRGELARGMTVERCVAELCAGDGGAALGATEPPSTVSAPGTPPAAADCRAECQALERAGELREGMTLEQCYETLCSGDAG